MQTQAARLLVKRAAGTAVPKTLSATGNKFEVTKPLFAAAAPDQRWYRIETNGRATIAQLWDAAYEMHAQSAGSVVEPDSETLWPMPTTGRQRGLFAGGRSDRGGVDPQSPDFPQGPGFAWHLNPQYSQLEARRVRQLPIRSRCALLSSMLGSTSSTTRCRSICAETWNGILPVTGEQMRPIRTLVGS